MKNPKRNYTQGNFRFYLTIVDVKTEEALVKINKFLLKDFETAMEEIMKKFK